MNGIYTTDLKKICVDCRLLDRVQNSGISRYTEFLINYYISRYGELNIYLVTNDPNLKYLDCRIVYTKLLPYRIHHFVIYHQLISRFKFSIYHAPFYSAFSVKLKGTKTIVTVHDLMYKLVPEFFTKSRIINKLKSSYYDFIVRHSLRTADKIVVVSDTTKTDVFKTFKLKSVHIPENSEIISGLDISILNRMGLKEKEFYFYCGNNRPHKNLDFIIQIFNRMPDLPPLILAGKDHLASKNVIPTGVVSDEELKALYVKSAAYIFPSIYEGFGLPIIEALRLGTPVIASKISAFKEFKSKNIFFFELGSEAEFLKSLTMAKKEDFFIEPHFFKPYQLESIYEKTDLLIRELDLS